MLDNECYATTGRQPVPNATNVEYDVLAKGSGYPDVYAFDTLSDFSNAIEGILSRPGPVFVSLKVEPEIINEPIGKRRRWQTRSKEQAIADWQKELGSRPR